MFAKSAGPASGIQLGRGIFLVNVRIKWLLWNVDMHVECALKWWNAFRPRRLAQSAGPASATKLVCGIFPVNFVSSGSCQMSKCISTAQARTKCVCVSLCVLCSLADRALLEILSEILPGDLSWSSCTWHCVEILLQMRSCQEISYINLAKRSLIESLCRDLMKRSCQEISYRDLVQEVLPRHFLQRSVQRSCHEVCYSDFANRALIEILHRSCQETSYGDRMQRPGEGSRGLAWRSFIGSLNRDLTLWDPLQGSFCGDLPR